MNTDHVTAYALGELSGREREEFERKLAGSPELQKELQEVTATCDALTGPPEEDLGNERRTRLLEMVRRNLEEGRRRRSTRRKILITSITALAACLLVIPSLPWTNPAPPQAGERSRGTGDAPAESPLAQVLPGTSREEKLLAAVPQEPPPTAPATAADVLAVTSAPAPSAGAVASSGPPVAVQKQTATAGAANVMNIPLSMMTASSGFEIPVRRFKTDAPSPSAPLERSKKRHVDVDAARAVGSSRAAAGFNTETYDAITDNAFLEATSNPLSTFSIDVDTASYANVRRFLNNDELPPAGAVRIEELINYFPYSYPQPEGDAPFSVQVETSQAPWAPERELVRIGLKGREMDSGERPPANLVFLVDVSGSMSPENKLPLLKRSLRELVARLDGRDRVAIVVYAGASGLALPPTAGSDQGAILAALDRLDAGGSTNGAQGITLAYETAAQHFQKDGINRVILCTDGDFNVGITDQSSLTTLIEKQRASGVFLSVLGFGEGNLKDSTMEKLADKGNGNYAYIDSLSEGKKVLVNQMGGTLFTIAKDVKIQVEFNPARVAAYRLIGYENRLLAKEDFNDDKKDAGEIGAGHTVTALYEIVPAGGRIPGAPSVDPLKYQAPARTAGSGDLLTLKLRYKTPEGGTSRLITQSVPWSEPRLFEKASADHRFAAAVAAFGMKLRGAPGSEAISWTEIQSAARSALDSDPGSYRAEFLTLVEKAKNLTPETRKDAE